MSDPNFGLLSLPAEPPGVGATLTDPALDMILDFCKSVLNADLADAWASRAAADPLPVAFTFAHDPDLEDFNSNELPALYMWRADDAGTVARVSQDLVVDEGGFHALWVPPPATFENRQERAGMRNGLKKSLTAALGQGRHPAWVVDDDDYYEPGDYGSVLLHHVKFMRLRFGACRAHKLVIQNDDGRGSRAPFECIFFTLEGQETLTKDGVPLTNASGYSQLNAHTGTVTLAERNDEGLDEGATLDLVDYQLEPSIVSVDPEEGTEAGGTDITITGTQFIDHESSPMRVFFGDEESLLVQYVNESTLIARSPAGTGVVDITVHQVEGGVTKTLANAFTYT